MTQPLSPEMKSFACRVMNAGIALLDFYEPEQLEEWFSTGQPAFGGAKPFDLLMTAEGARLVFDFIERLRDGAHI